MPSKKYAETQRKWEERNPDYYKDYVKTHNKANCERVKKFQRFKKIQLIFLRILLDELDELDNLGD